jgi:hypothetical protein
MLMSWATLRRLLGGSKSVSSFTSAPKVRAHHRVYVLRCLCDLGIYDPGGRAPEAHSANGTPACSVRPCGLSERVGPAALVQYIARHDAMNLIR